MVLQIYNGEKIGPGPQADLSTTDSVYVGENGFLGSTDDAAIYGAGNYHQIVVEGTAVGRNYGIYLDHDPVEHVAQSVMIGDQGKVYGGATAIVVYAYDSYVENDGKITGNSAIYIKGDDHGGSYSTIVNDGLINTAGAAIFAYGTQDLYITNNGTIKSRTPVFDYSYSEGNMYFTNNGRIVGGINFGGGSTNVFETDDVYDGARGTVTGIVRGGHGDDTLTGGKAADRFQGDIGRDMLRGGGGPDQFIFADLLDSTTSAKGRDLIYGFSHRQHDRIDLSMIDARDSSMADNAFTLIGEHKFSGKQGELNYAFKNGNTIVQGDVDGDGTPDFAIELTGKIHLTASDFHL